MSDILRFKGVAIQKDDFEDKYDIELSETEWKAVITHASASWEQSADELRLMISRHVRTALNEVGYKPTLEGKELKYKKIKD